MEPDIEDLPLGLPPEEAKLFTTVSHRTKLTPPQLPDIKLGKPKARVEPEIYVLSKDRSLHGKGKSLF